MMFVITPADIFHAVFFGILIFIIVMIELVDR